MSCGHAIFHNECECCRDLKKKWYQRIKRADRDWRDIEYGLESPRMLYKTVESIDLTEDIEPEQATQSFYDFALEVYWSWVSSGRSKRECLIAELYGMQDGKSGTVRGIGLALKRKRLKPNSVREVHKVIQEIDQLIVQRKQGRLSVEQGEITFHTLESKPLKDDANGKTSQDPTGRAA